MHNALNLNGKNIRMKRILSIIVALAAVLSLAVCAFADEIYCPWCDAWNSGAGERCSVCGRRLEGAVAFETVRDSLVAGDVVTLGAYEQDQDTDNGAEPIEWLVLEVSGSSAIMISRYALECMPFNDEYGDVTWETCSLRAWLNDDFIAAAFSESEAEMLTETKVKAETNPNYETDPGNDTTDKVFLLSLSEAEKYFPTDEERRCTVTDYVLTEKPFFDTDDMYGWWWLRTPGSTQKSVTKVLFNGYIYTGGSYADDDLNVVRPVISVKLK